MADKFEAGKKYKHDSSGSKVIYDCTYADNEGAILKWNKPSGVYDGVYISHDSRFFYNEVIKEERFYNVYVNRNFQPVYLFESLEAAKFSANKEEPHIGIIKVVIQDGVIVSSEVAG